MFHALLILAVVLPFVLAALVVAILYCNELINQTKGPKP